MYNNNVCTSVLWCGVCVCVCVCVCKGSLVPSFSMLHAEKHVTCNIKKLGAGPGDEANASVCIIYAQSCVSSVYGVSEALSLGPFAAFHTSIGRAWGRG